MPPTPRGEFTPVDRLLQLVTLSHPTPAEVRAIRERLAPAAGLDWREFRRKVRHNDVAPLVHLTLDRLGLLEALPIAIADELRRRREEIAALNAARLQVAGDLFARFRQAGCPVVVLKGVAFGAVIYGDPGYKKMNDVDILIRPEDATRVRDLYHAAGLFPLALLEGGDGDEAPDPAKTHHLPAYVSRDLGFVVGTHWGLVSRKSGYRLDYPGIWQRALPLTVAGQPVAMLAPEDNLHHLCVHFHYYKTGLKELGDFANLIRFSAPFPWDRFAGLVREAGSATPVFRTLTLVEELYKVGIPTGLLGDWRTVADPFVVEDTLRLAARRDLLLLSRSTWSSEIEKAYLAFTFENRFLAKWEWLETFWQRLLLPPREVVYRTNACRRGEQPTPWLYWRNLVRTAREVGRDFGLAIFGLLMVKSVAELALALRDQITGRSEGRLAALAKTLGMPEERLFSLMEKME